MASLNFNAATVKPSTGYEALPSGWYTAKIVESELKPTSAGGEFWAFTFKVLAPAEFAGRTFYDNLNVVHTNPTVVEIAFASMSAICHAVNVIQVTDSSQLHEKPLDVQLMLTPATEAVAATATAPAKKGYDAGNRVKGYRATTSGAAVVGSPAAAPAWASVAPAWASVAPVTAAPAQKPAFQAPQAAVVQTPPPGWYQDAAGNWLQAPVAAAAPVTAADHVHDAGVGFGVPTSAPVEAPAAMPPWAAAAAVPAPVLGDPLTAPVALAAAAPSAVPPWAKK